MSATVESAYPTATAGNGRKFRWNSDRRHIEYESKWLGWVWLGCLAIDDVTADEHLVIAGLLASAKEDA